MANNSTSMSSVKHMMDEGLSARDIADRLGLSVVQVRILMKAVDPSYKPTVKSNKISFGLTNSTSNLRYRLCTMLYKLWRNLGCDYVALSASTGLNRFEISRAMTRPFMHDWRLAQIERLHMGLGIELDLIDLMKPTEYSSYSELQKFWDSVSDVKRI